MLVDIIFTLHWSLLSFRRSNITLGIAVSIIVQGYSNNDIFVLLPQAIVWEYPCFPHHQKREFGVHCFDCSWDDFSFYLRTVEHICFLSLLEWTPFPYSISVAAWHFLLGILGHSVVSLRSTVCTPRRSWMYAKD